MKKLFTLTIMLILTVHVSAQKFDFNPGLHKG